MRRIVLLFALAGCAGEGAPAPHQKPTAPVDVTLTSRPLGGDEYEVTLSARPTRDVPALELALDGRRVEAGATRRGEVRTLTTRIRLGAEPRREIAGVAWAGGRSRAGVVALGAPAAVRALPTRLVTMPDGVVVEEVRP